MQPSNINLLIILTYEVNIDRIENVLLYIYKNLLSTGEMVHNEKLFNVNWIVFNHKFYDSASVAISIWLLTVAPVIAF